MIATITGLHEPKNFIRGSGQSWFVGDLVQILTSSQDVYGGGKLEAAMHC